MNELDKYNFSWRTGFFPTTAEGKVKRDIMMRRERKRKNGKRR